MKIMLAAAVFSSEMSGVQRHAFNVVRCLLAKPEVSAVHLVIAPWQRALVQSFGFDMDARLKVHLAAMERNTISRNLWYARILPHLASQEGVDLVHLSYPVPVPRKSFEMPVVVTLHDLYPYEIPHNFGLSKAIFHRLILRQCVRHVNGIACVSEITVKHLREYLPHVRTKAVRIYNCVTPSLREVDRPPIPGWEETPFLLCIAQHRRNKNIPLLLHIFSGLLKGCRIDNQMRLLVVGIPGPETQRIQRTIVRLGLQDRVILLDGLSEAELQWCYTRCEVLVAPSSTEGFGLPITEALLAGCRIVCSDISAFREIGNMQCNFVALDNNAMEGFRDAIAQVITRPRPVPVVLPHLSIQELGAQYLGFYRQLISEAPADARAHKGATERLLG